MGGAVGSACLVGVIGLAALFAFGGSLSALWVTGLATTVLVGVCVLETLLAGKLERDA
jgi:hypothetical protein